MNEWLQWTALGLSVLACWGCVLVFLGLGKSQGHLMETRRRVNALLDAKHDEEKAKSEEATATGTTVSVAGKDVLTVRRHGRRQGTAPVRPYGFWRP